MDSKERQYQEWLEYREEKARLENLIDSWLLTIGGVASVFFFAWLYFREGAN